MPRGWTVVKTPLANCAAAFGLRYQGGCDVARRLWQAVGGAQVSCVGTGVAYPPVGDL